MSPLASLAWRPGLDESLAVLELRRFRRWFGSVERPIAFIAAVLVVPWVAAPAIIQAAALSSMSPRLDPRWPFGSLLVSLALGMALAAYVRASQFWASERHSGTLDTWLVASGGEEKAIRSVGATSTLFALLLAAIPLLIWMAAGIALRARWWQWAEAFLLLALCMAVGACAGNAAFFISQGLARRRWLWFAVLLLAAGAVALWLRSETVQYGWSRPWEERPGRILTAAALVTPVPALYGIGVPEWWREYCARTVGIAAPAWAAGLLYAGVLLAAVGLFWHTCRSGFRRLREEPERLARPRRARFEAGREDDPWYGAGNPVWTRDLRTRLRSRESAEFIFLASLAVAAGGFAPLILAARDLSDPLQTAAVARQTFYWLTVTLMGLVALVTPGLASEAFAVERRCRSIEFLVASPLRAREILSGKLLGTLCLVGLLVSPSLPLFALCYLFRGASAGQLLSVYLLLFATAALTGYFGVTASAIYSAPAAAKIQAYCLSLLLVAVPGGAFSMVAAVASPVPELRGVLAGGAGITPVLILFTAILAVLLWRNASDQLRHVPG